MRGPAGPTLSIVFLLCEKVVEGWERGGRRGVGGGRRWESGGRGMGEGGRRCEKVGEGGRRVEEGLEKVGEGV